MDERAQPNKAREMVDTCTSSSSRDGSSSSCTSAACPVCGVVLSLAEINSHIDLCLVSAGGETADRDGGVGSRPVLKSPSSARGGRQGLLPFGGQKRHTSQLDEPYSKSRRIDHAFTGVEERSKQLTLSASSSVDSVQSSVGSSKDGTKDSLGIPLAEAARPSKIHEYVGQHSVLGKDSMLYTVLESGDLPSLIFWGPPGCGKTTLARILARSAQEKQGARFVQLSATTSGVADLKEAIKLAKNEKSLLRKKTILFIDEIHRFNKLQQDTFLPHIEDGTITLLGATTENPSFELNGALLSRCQVIVLKKLDPHCLESVLKRALPLIGATAEKETTQLPLNGAVIDSEVVVMQEAISVLSELCDGDARRALNALQIAVQSKHTLMRVARSTVTMATTTAATSITAQNSASTAMETLVSLDYQATPSNGSRYIVTAKDAKESLQQGHLLYDRAGEEHYDCVSALHKSMRGSDPTASLYWLARMLDAGEDPLYVARRVVRFASEDIGLADPNALVQAVAAFQACQFIGMPECEVCLAQAVVYMARSPKSIEVYSAYGQAKSCIKEWKGPMPSVPLHLRNAPTKLMRGLGYGKGYKYNPAHPEGVEQQYLPDGMENVNFFT